jgi:hypothetical protein
MSESWFEMLDRAKALGLEYANNGIAAGDRQPDDAPLSGEWAGAILPKDVVEQLGGDFDTLEGWEVADILDHWEDGYNSAEWPERPDSE